MTATSATAGRILDGRYELRDLIGQGTFGRVYRGHDQRLDRLVAIKVIKPWWTEDPEWVERFELEAQLMARVRHPGIVQIHDIGHDQASLYYVAELIDGESLAGRLRRGPLTPSQARDIAEQLCRGLAEAHRQQVVHRDIKPANVLIDRGGRVKVGDFGIARLAEAGSEGAAGTILGTPGYMAPEQARGRFPTPASDVCSVGVVLYEMLAGRRPAGEEPAALAPGTPRALVQIVRRALANEPSERYPSAAEMAEALAGADLGRPGPASTRVKRLSTRVDVNPAERRRYGALLAAVVVLLAAMAGAAIVTANGTARVPDVHGLRRAAVAAKLRARDLRARFSTGYSSAPLGTAVAQRPAAGSRVGDGSTLQVVLSAGPPPVDMPQLLGQSTSAAQAILGRLGLTAVVTAVPAPGVTPGLVVAQSPSASASTAARSTVRLSVAEVPRWRPLTSFSGDGSGQSVPFRIRGDRWRVLYGMGWDGTCGFLGLFCSGPSAQVTKPASGAMTSTFSLNNGTNQTQVFNSGPGVYQITVTPGADNAHWSIEVEDDY